jgi:hypothetical protein
MLEARTEPRRGEVRLAELVAALSLGIDLGFAQPMEHALRQCLIALRLAERIGLDEKSSAAVYFTSLLISVGCHADAHEQAKWLLAKGELAILPNEGHWIPDSAVEVSIEFLRQRAA